MNTELEFVRWPETPLHVNANVAAETQLYLRCTVNQKGETEFWSDRFLQFFVKVMREISRTLTCF